MREASTSSPEPPPTADPHWRRCVHAAIARHGAPRTAHLELERLIQTGAAHTTHDAAENAAHDQIDRAWALDALGHHTDADHLTPDVLELDTALLISTFERRGWTEPAPTPPGKAATVS